MTKFFTLFLLLVSITSIRTADAAVSKDPTEKKKILFICTSSPTFNATPNGTFLSELAVPFILFHELGYEIDIVSPQGGAIPIYYKFDTTEILWRALKSSYYQNKITHSLKPQQVKPKNYTAVILPGGYGQFVDVHSNAALNNIIRDIYANNGFIGTLGHGASSLVHVKDQQGQWLVKGKTLTCFPTWFEKEIMSEANHGELLPFDMEVELQKKGADLKQVQKNGANKDVVDAPHRLVTTAFSDGGEFVVTSLHQLIIKQ
ncbi:MAG: ThiJ/PfpI protein [Cytophagaceae bacterium]|jgi:putative intracellular protease/amidase|nr:ThiJ/PfpI protein [Cytophagaceae bacterium]